MINTYIVAAILAILATMLIFYLYNGIGKTENYKNEGIRTLPTKPAGKLTLYYTSWCGHSKRFMPEWNKFVAYANQYIPYLQVDTIKCEGKNEASCSHIEGYPTVILINQQNKQKIYDGERTMEGLIKFVKNHL